MLTERKAVFDLQTHSIWLTQASSCGSTPAALKDVTDLSRVVGKCEVQPGQKEAVVDVVSETAMAAPSSTTDTDAVTRTGGLGLSGFVTTTLAVPTAAVAATSSAGGGSGGGGVSATALASFGVRMTGDKVLSVAVAVVVVMLGSLL